MSLAEVYNDWFVEGEESEKVAEAEIEKIASIIDDSGLTEDECEKLAEACYALDEEGYDFESAEEKLAAAAEVIDAIEGGEVDDSEEDERVAAEYDAAGRIMAQGFLDELYGEEEVEKEAAKGDLTKKLIAALKDAYGAKSLRSGLSAMKSGKKNLSAAQNIAKSIGKSSGRGKVLGKAIGKSKKGIATGRRRALRGGAGTAAAYGVPAAGLFAAGRASKRNQ